MKKFYLLLLLIGISFCCRANDIDSIKTIDDVRYFLKHILKAKDNVDFFAEPKVDSTFKLSRISFLKIDLNNDGLTDLIVNGTYLFAVVDDGRGFYKVSFIDRGTFMSKKFVLADIDTSQKQPRIIIAPFNRYKKLVVDSAVFDTLIIKYDGFIEYSAKADTSPIEKISLTTTNCFGRCPVFKLSVNCDGNAIYNAIEYNDRKGIFKSKIDTASLNRLLYFTEYIRAKSLKDQYKVNWTDDQTADLTITYKDGTVKTISDYGLVGTFGLARIYNIFLKIRKTGKWKRV